MSGSAYRLEAARQRPPPPPLRFQNSAFSSSPPSLNKADSQTLLYDLPSAPSIISPQSSTGISPSSPTFPGRSRGGRLPRRTPPPSSRNRSLTPSGVARSDLEVFAEQCRAWYFNQSENAGRLMTQTLANLPASQRAPFSRLQASIRSAYHAHINARRTAEFNAHLSTTQPGGSLTAHNRADPQGSMAQKERYQRFDRFIRNWCTLGMPGTKPFFESLWTIMRLQVVPRELGGAGANRIEWELDDAVFKEAAGKEFMLEAIDVLKGVLGFEETSSSRCISGSSRFLPSLDSPPLHSRSRSQPYPRPQQPKRIVQPKRARAPSDPFLDTPGLSHSVPTSSSHSSGATALLSALGMDTTEEPPSPISPTVDPDEFLNSIRDRDCPLGNEAEDEPLRVWTSPDLSNPEFLSLLKTFPPFVTRRALPRFPITSAREGDLEEAEEERGEGKEIQASTGTLWVSFKLRSDGWSGSWWTRFVSWWRKVFSFC